jgi:hypothetical protein
MSYIKGNVYKKRRNKDLTLQKVLKYFSIIYNYIYDNKPIIPISEINILIMRLHLNSEDWKQDRLFFNKLSVKTKIVIGNQWAQNKNNWIIAFISYLNKMYKR